MQKLLIIALLAFLGFSYLIYNDDDGKVSTITNIVGDELGVSKETVEKIKSTGKEVGKKMEDTKKEFDEKQKIEKEKKAKEQKEKAKASPRPSTEPKSEAKK